MPSGKVGSLLFSEARAIRIREPEALESIHSAVHSAVHVLVDSHSEAEAVLSSWKEIMQAAADAAEEVIATVRNNAS